MKNLVLLFFILSFKLSLQAQFVHPGLTNKRSDLDRVKYMVEAQIDPWYSSYQEMASDSRASFNYSVLGRSSFTVLGRDDGTNYNAWNNDIRAAYYNAIRWYVTGDTRHAEKAIEIFNAWNNLQDVTSGGTQALSGAVVYIMIEAAEIIKSTYDGWAADDIQAFKDMLVYPGYSTTAEPAGISRTSGSFYWQAYQGDSVRHGNQGLAGFRAVMAMGIFLDNEIMYDRALRYIQGLPHRPDDLPYPPGPPQATAISSQGNYEDTYNFTVGNSVEDFGYNEVMTNYIYENGQCQESSRDQQHTFFGIGNLCAMAEMAWNQGDDLYSHVNDRLLLGLEYTARYNVSFLRSYPDQPEWWVPTVASGEFTQRFNASQRVFAKFISPTHVGGYVGVRPILEMPLAHYEGRGFKTPEEVLWTKRARDVSFEETGYEKAGHQNGAIGWGALTSRRPEGCYGEPISGFDSNGLPIYAMNVLPATIEAENFDYSPVSGEDRIYNDTTNGNSENQYRTDENVDINIDEDGEYYISSIVSGEWLTYTIYIPETTTYNISINYAAVNSTGEIQFEFAGSDKTGEVTLPSTGGDQTWGNHTVSEGVLLSQGVQSMRIMFGGVLDSFSLNNINISGSSACVAGLVDTSEKFSEGVKYNYYEGSWNNIPDFSSEEIIRTGITSEIGLNNGEREDLFGYSFEGYLLIEEEGDYTFYTNSDDGSNLYINGVKIVDNDGRHGEIEVSGDICLQLGYHEIKVTYFENKGTNDVLDVEYEGPGISKKNITNLFYTNENTLDVDTFEHLFPEINIYPNPVISSAVIKNASNLNMVVFDINGRTKFQKTITDNNETINLNTLPTGVYYAVLNKQSKREVIKLIKK